MENCFSTSLIEKVFVFGYKIIKKYYLCISLLLRGTNWSASQEAHVRPTSEAVGSSLSSDLW